SFIGNPGIESALKLRIYIQNLAVIGPDGPYRCAIRIKITCIFYLDHADISARLEGAQVRIFILPQSNFLVIENCIDVMSYKPRIAFVPGLTRSKGHQL